MHILTIENDRLSVGVTVQGGVVTSARTRAGLPFLRGLEGAFSPRHAGCFPLVPIGNRVTANRFKMDGREYLLQPNDIEPLYLHGDGWLSEWAVEEARPNRLRLSLEVTDPQFGPHRYRAEQIFTVEGDRLQLQISVENRGEEALPFGIGLHPYFPNDGARISFSAARFWTEGPDHIPDQPGPVPKQASFARPRPLRDLALNNAYAGWQGSARIRWPDSGLVVEMLADPVFDTLMAYAPADDRSFFCLEPMSHLPDALTKFGPEGMQVLAPGELLSGSVWIRAIAPDD